MAFVSYRTVSCRKAREGDSFSLFRASADVTVPSVYQRRSLASSNLYMYRMQIVVISMRKPCASASDPAAVKSRVCNTMLMRMCFLF